MMSASPESYFPEDYRGARRAFIAACEARGVDVIARVHPAARGPDGKPLFLDTAAMGPRHATRALLLICGTHGVEGYFGSGVMTGLMCGGIAPPADARLVMIHALNPFGFAWNRRVNEDNVDLNRNFVDHADPPDNPGYDALAEAIAPRVPPGDGWAAADAVLEDWRQRHGDRAWQQAISAGQYRHPDGLFYGGTRESWSAQALRAVLTEDLAKVERLVAVDFHTGLGAPGAGEIIVESAPGTPAHARALAIWSGGVHAAATGESLSTPLTGTLDQGLERMLPGAEVTCATLEVGTVALPAMFDALRLANWQDHFAPDTTHNAGMAADIERRMRDAFYGDTPVWKQAVWTHAQACVGAALAGL